MMADGKLEACNDLSCMIYSNRVSEITLTKDQRNSVVDLLHFLPQATAATTISGAWVARIPKGYTNKNLMRFDDGGVGSALQVNGKVEGHASFHSLGMQGVVYNLFNLLSAATGQYFLSRIDSQLSLVNSKLDDVLNFLYGENRAELLAEIFFVKRTHENYSSIVSNPDQRVATISGLQASQKIAVKDIEFYLTDIENIAQKQVTDFKSLCAEETSAWKALNCVELALQTLVISSILEIYLSGNDDDSYVDYTRRTLESYMNRCDNSIVSSFSIIDSKFAHYHQGVFENAENRQKYRTLIKESLAPYKKETDSPLRLMLKNSLNALKNETVCYVTNEGKVYVQSNLLGS